MTLPNFLIVGAAKSGTSALYAYLRKHPDIFMSENKEPNFFALEGQKVNFSGPGDKGINRRSITRLAVYESLFARVKHEHAIGEASTIYLYHPQAPSRIKHYVPHAKLIAILRNPMDRAYSAFLHTRRDGREPESDFSTALLAESDRINAGWAHLWHYTRMGFYSVQIERYLNYFPQTSIAIYTYDEFKRNPDTLLREIFSFLEVEPNVVINTTDRYNVSGPTRVLWLQKWITQPHRTKDFLKPFIPSQIRERVRVNLMTANIKSDKPEPMSSFNRKQLQALFREDILRLQDLIEKDLSKWLFI
ncbi:MAG: sulfotransferase [Chloroflexota bacterium]|jgi:hypothetical protein